MNRENRERRTAMGDERGGRRREETYCQACIWFDRYEVREILGEGGTGKVYLAKDLRLGRPVAIKVLEQVTEQFGEEVALLQKQKFLMLPTVFDAWMEDDKTGVIIMEYVEGQNLGEYLSLHKQVPEKQVYRWGLQLGEFLKQLHSANPKILYRDLKPENIMVQPDLTLRLVDVGAAVRLGTEDAGRGRRVGTFGYAAPEQWDGKAVDERADIYGLGAVLCAIMAGEGKLNSQAAAFVERGRMPEGMALTVGRCLQREREKRYATADAFLADWKRYKWIGRTRSFLCGAAGILKYSLLCAAVYIAGHRQESVSLVWAFLAGYLGLKAAEWILAKNGRRWEQKKSVWCRGID